MWKPERCQRPTRPSRLRGPHRAYLHLGREFTPRPDTLTQTVKPECQTLAERVGHTLTAKVGNEPVSEGPVPHCARSQQSLRCGAVKFHAAPQLWISSFVRRAAKSSGEATKPPAECAFAAKVGPSNNWIRMFLGSRFAGTPHLPGTLDTRSGVRLRWTHGLARLRAIQPPLEGG